MNGASCYEWSTEVHCNWKLLRDAFKEAYHVAFLHRRSARDSYTGPRNPFSHALYFKLFPLHQRWSLPANPQYRPSPFCLLDEVGAPLDEANVGRFTNKVVAMSANTQFIVITHNKRTMETARALYGVTMEEVGVSKLVSVRFE